jgi:cysteine desulfurase|tara:strand:+ start:83 stop:1225 length:1143 start_codon:yes stop_codon:yes gene_type:complete
MTSTSVYLDNAASTPLDPAVLEAMLPWFIDCPANPSGRHEAGQAAGIAIEQAREQVSTMLGCQADTVTFTASATESCNLAIKGLLRPRLRRGERVHIVSSAIEHLAVLDPLRRLEREGAEVDLAPPTPGGWIDPSEVERRLQDDTAMVSIMWVNNELGTINDIAAIGEMCRDRGILFFCDGSQAAGKLPIDLDSLPIDAFCVCAHKMNGPKGTAALVVQGRAAGRPLEPLIEGGGQEQGLRSGTLDVPGLVGFGAAAHRVSECLGDDLPRIMQLRDTLQAGIVAAHPLAVANGDPSRRVPHILNMTIPTAGPEPLMEQIQGVTCSGGAACPSAKGEPSHVLAAIGLQSEAAATTTRLSLGRTTTADDILAAIAAFKRVGQ